MNHQVPTYRRIAKGRVLETTFERGLRELHLVCEGYPP